MLIISPYLLQSILLIVGWFITELETPETLDLFDENSTGSLLSFFDQTLLKDGLEATSKTPRQQKSLLEEDYYRPPREQGLKNRLGIVLLLEFCRGIMGRRDWLAEWETLRLRVVVIEEYYDLYNRTAGFVKFPSWRPAPRERPCCGGYTWLGVDLPG